MARSRSERLCHCVIPAPLLTDERLSNAGPSVVAFIHFESQEKTRRWIPAFAGMTSKRLHERLYSPLA
jgi:hypothetical protein